MNDRAVDSRVVDMRDVLELERVVLAQGDLGGGISSITFTREDSWGLSIAYAPGGQRAMLVLSEPPGGQSWSSRDIHAEDGAGHELVVFDFMGSWSEADAAAFIALEDAHLALESFVRGEPAMEPRILWTRD